MGELKQEGRMLPQLGTCTAADSEATAVPPPTQPPSLRIYMPANDHENATGVWTLQKCDSAIKENVKGMKFNRAYA